MERLDQFERDLIREIERLKNDLIKDTISLINIPSKKAGPIGPVPFGSDIQSALEMAMEIGEREGFATKNIDNYMAYASIGESNNYIGILGHLDVVSEGEVGEWTYPPFAGEIHDNKIYGRGALDNKGPLMAAFYGLIALKKTGYEFNNEIRMIFGTDEESGMSDLSYYLEKEAPPIMGFVPDNKFPAIYGERGRAEIAILGDVDKFYEEYFIDSKNATEKLGINYSDRTFGNTIIKRVTKKPKAISLIISTPVIEIDDLVKKIEEKAEGLDVRLVKYYEPAIKSRDSLLVATLNAAYNDVMDDNLEVDTTTGITYAHYCPNVIGFGPSFPGQNGISHAPDEWIDIDDMVKMAQIYAVALYRLDQLKLN